ncbi:MAG: FG-GAP repeat protein [Anaerolineales bacterium]
MAILLFLLSSCRSTVQPTAPASQSFTSPVNQITFHTTLTLGSKEAPDDHWVGFFGGSVDIDGDVLVTGEPFWGRPPGEGAGAAYVFRKTSEGGWQLEATLLPSDRNSGFQEDQH